MGTLISQNIPYSATTLSQQSTPIGAIIPYMGTTAPSGYLACDGGVYAISLYPLLAGFFEAQFGSINYFGGDGTTTFAVPNLQGEFIRGAGTNSHSNQGSGGSVGEHQDGTTHARYQQSDQKIITPGTNISAANTDKYYYYSSSDSSYSYVSTTKTVRADQYYSFTSRPTNTSVLYIIKAKSDRLDKITFAEVDDASTADDVVWSGEKISNEISRITEYSTSEKVVGRWIDGKKIYQKTLSTNKSFATANPVWVNEIVDVSGLNINKLIDVKIIDNAGMLICPFVLHRINNGFLSGYYALYGIGNQVLQSVTLQYTKTTD